MTDWSRLSPLQGELLRAFFDRTDSFFLTGGAALAAFYLGHRQTKDLDLFAMPGVNIEDGVRAVRSSAQALGALAELMQESPDFRRFGVQRGDDVTLVDLVIDRAPQIVRTKPRVDHIRIDPLREIAANKLCALLGRAVPRDFVDFKLLLESGMPLEDIMADAQIKDASADPATLAWVLSGIKFGPRAPVPPGTTVEDLNSFRDALIARLSRMALPPE